VEGVKYERGGREGRDEEREGGKVEIRGQRFV